MIVYSTVMSIEAKQLSIVATQISAVGDSSRALLAACLQQHSLNRKQLHLANGNTIDLIPSDSAAMLDFQLFFYQALGNCIKKLGKHLDQQQPINCHCLLPPLDSWRSNQLNNAALSSWLNTQLTNEIQFTLKQQISWQELLNPPSPNQQIIYLCADSLLDQESIHELIVTADINTMENLIIGQAAAGLLINQQAPALTVTHLQIHRHMIATSLTATRDQINQLTNHETPDILLPIMTMNEHHNHWQQLKLHCWAYGKQPSEINFINTLGWLGNANPMMAINLTLARLAYPYSPANTVLIYHPNEEFIDLIFFKAMPEFKSRHHIPPTLA